MMNNLLQTLIISLSVALILSISDGSSSSSSSENDIAGFKTQDEEAALDKVVGVRRLPSNYYYNMACDKYLPGVCRLKSNSGGPDCCKNKCVNVKSDKMNCGKCGYKCRYTEICCEGQCMNASFDTRNCGGCNNKCNKGELCVYGMCNYA